MRFFYLVFSLFLSFVLCASSFAQQVEVRTFCASVTEGDADYIAGVDVKNKPVVPADIEKPLQAIQYPISIPIEVVTLEWLGIDILEAGKLLSAESGVKIASIELFEDGHIEYNGQDISDRVSHACSNDPDQPVIPKSDEEPEENVSVAKESENAPVKTPETQPDVPVTEGEGNPALSKDGM